MKETTNEQNTEQNEQNTEQLGIEPMPGFLLEMYALIAEIRVLVSGDTDIERLKLTNDMNEKRVTLLEETLTTILHILSNPNEAAAVRVHKCKELVELVAKANDVSNAVKEAPSNGNPQETQTSQ